MNCSVGPATFTGCNQKKTFEVCAYDEDEKTVEGCPYNHVAVELTIKGKVPRQVSEFTFKGEVFQIVSNRFCASVCHTVVVGWRAELFGCETYLVRRCVTLQGCSKAFEEIDLGWGWVEGKMIEAAPGGASEEDLRAAVCRYAVYGDWIRKLNKRFDYVIENQAGECFHVVAVHDLHQKSKLPHVIVEATEPKVLN